MRLNKANLVGSDFDEAKKMIDTVGGVVQANNSKLPFDDILSLVNFFNDKQGSEPAPSTSAACNQEEKKEPTKDQEPLTLSQKDEKNLERIMRLDKFCLVHNRLEYPAPRLFI